MKEIVYKELILIVLAQKTNKKKPAFYCGLMLFQSHDRKLFFCIFTASMYLISYFFFSLYAFQRKSSNTFRNEPAIAAKRLIQPSRPLSIGTFMKYKIIRHTAFVKSTHAIQKTKYMKALVLLVRKLFPCFFIKITSLFFCFRFGL